LKGKSQNPNTEKKSKEKKKKKKKKKIQTSQPKKGPKYRKKKIPSEEDPRIERNYIFHSTLRYRTVKRKTASVKRDAGGSLGREGGKGGRGEKHKRVRLKVFRGGVGQGIMGSNHSTWEPRKNFKTDAFEKGEKYG